MAADSPGQDAGHSEGRGRGFPQMPLGEAVRILQDAGRAGSRHSLAAWAGYMGHSTTASGPFRSKLAALRNFQLIDKSRDPIGMTALGKEIALPVSHEAMKDAVRRAFLNPETFRKLYEDAAKGVPLDNSFLANVAARNLGVGLGSKRSFVHSFVASAVEAGLAEEVGEDAVKLISLPVEGQAAEESSVRVLAIPGAERAEGAHGSSPVQLHQVWALATGEVLLEIRSSKPLPVPAYAHLGNVVASIAALIDIVEKGNGDDGL